jgi:ubiquinone/menaquinone biosynthesis C-methylase UbiE
VLDLGCGHHSLLIWSGILPRLDLSLGVELHEPALLEAKRKRIHTHYARGDATTIEFKPNSFDAVVAVELLEHLPKDVGGELLRRMERWARKRVVLTTPNGFVFQDDVGDNPFQEHLSGWTAQELRQFGFQVYGLSGWRPLRGYLGRIRFKPWFFWKKVSSFSQLLVRHWPEQAFQLLAVKEIDEAD